MYYFHSQVSFRGTFQDQWSVEVLKNEPMFFNADLNFAWEKGGEITRAFLDALPKDWKDCNPVCDSRVHMLMRGWFPCIPGYHHDDVARDASGQPNYQQMPYQSEHLMGLVNGQVCPTVFALGEHILPSVEGIVYKAWHPMVEQQITEGILTPWEATSGQLIQFDFQAMHTGQRAKHNGWRWFVRLSRNTERQKSITNELRRQVQVYLEFPMEGW